MPKSSGVRASVRLRRSGSASCQDMRWSRLAVAQFAGAGRARRTGPVQTGALLRECIDDLRIAIDSPAGHDDGFALMAGNLRFRVEPRLRRRRHHTALEQPGSRRSLARPPALLPLLRILQEALGNALRMFAPRRSRSPLRHDADGALELEVSDDGRASTSPPCAPARGLAGIEARAPAGQGDERCQWLRRHAAAGDGTRRRTASPVSISLRPPDRHHANIPPTHF